MFIFQIEYENFLIEIYKSIKVGIIARPFWFRLSNQILQWNITHLQFISSIQLGVLWHKKNLKCCQTPELNRKYVYNDQWTVPKMCFMFMLIKGLQSCELSNILDDCLCYLRLAEMADYFRPPTSRAHNFVTPMTYRNIFYIFKKVNISSLQNFCSRV